MGCTITDFFTILKQKKWYSGHMEKIITGTQLEDLISEGLRSFAPINRDHDIIAYV